MNKDDRRVLPSPKTYKAWIAETVPPAEEAAKAAQKYRQRIRRKRKKSLERNAGLERHIVELKKHSHQTRRLMGYLQWINPGEKDEKRLMKVSKLLLSERQQLRKMISHAT